MSRLRDEPATLDSSDGQRQLLRDYELLLVCKHRFALADVIVCVQAVAQELQGMHRVLNCIHSSSSPAAPEAGKQAVFLYDALGRMNCRLADVARVTPTFLGEQELGAFMDAMREFGKLSELELASELQLDANDTAIVEMLHRSVGVVAIHTEALDRSMTSSAPVCALLSKKRDHLARFLDEAVQVLQNSHTRRLALYESEVEQLLSDFKDALGDTCLQSAKQLRFDIQSIETSMATMLLPHFEICRTIATANAQVQATSSLLSKSECDQIDTFVRLARSLKSGAVAFHSVLEDPPAFLTQLQLFEKAASKVLLLLQADNSSYMLQWEERGKMLTLSIAVFPQDAFVVCSSALKLQFREAVDQELFLAYVDDWNMKRRGLQTMETSTEHRATANRLRDLKAAIQRASQRVQISKEKLALDDPARTKLVQEVARIFEDDGGTMKQLNLLVSTEECPI